MSDIQFDPTSLQKSAGAMSESAEELVRVTQDLLGEVGDPSVLGTNDTLGGIASALYGALLERVQETVESVAEEYAGQSGKLQGAAAAYAETETANTEAGQTMVEGD
ncbi:MAG: hypothetical protein L0G99_12140 [Propionibacteriales bacterium]|nr:hypothetical protein [Propionibacteriales bacterium]